MINFIHFNLILLFLALIAIQITFKRRLSVIFSPEVFLDPFARLCLLFFQKGHRRAALVGKLAAVRIRSALLFVIFSFFKGVPNCWRSALFYLYKNFSSIQVHIFHIFLSAIFIAIYKIDLPWNTFSFFTVRRGNLATPFIY